jgi:hypothetical protein
VPRLALHSPIKGPSLTSCPSVHAQCAPSMVNSPPTPLFPPFFTSPVTAHPIDHFPPWVGPRSFRGLSAALQSSSSTTLHWSTTTSVPPRHQCHLSASHCSELPPPHFKVVAPSQQFSSCGGPSRSAVQPPHRPSPLCHPAPMVDR